MPAQIERRRLSLPVELRADVSDKGSQISGYAAVFYDSRDAATQYELWDGCFERLQAGCFNSALKRPDDVRCLFNHDPNLIMGRSGPGTLKLSVDTRGLKFACDMPDSEFARGLAEAIRRGDISGCSFSFDCLVCTWTEDNANDCYYRDITDVTLYDVGPVTFPAYAATDVEANSIARRSLESFQKQSPKTGKRDRAARRLRLMS